MAHLNTVNKYRNTNLNVKWKNKNSLVYFCRSNAQYFGLVWEGRYGLNLWLIYSFVSMVYSWYQTKTALP